KGRRRSAAGSLWAARISRGRRSDPPRLGSGPRARRAARAREEIDSWPRVLLRRLATRNVRTRDAPSPSEHGGSLAPPAGLCKAHSNEPVTRRNRSVTLAARPDRDWSGAAGALVMTFT